jgi:hypothetical protein
MGQHAVRDSEIACIAQKGDQEGMVCIRKNSARAAEYFQAGIDAILTSDFLDPKARPSVSLRTTLALV